MVCACSSACPVIGESGSDATEKDPGSKWSRLTEDPLMKRCQKPWSFLDSQQVPMNVCIKCKEAIEFADIPMAVANIGDHTVWACSRESNFHNPQWQKVWSRLLPSSNATEEHATEVLKRSKDVVEETPKIFSEFERRWNKIQKSFMANETYGYSNYSWMSTEYWKMRGPSPATGRGFGKWETPARWTYEIQSEIATEYDGSCNVVATTTAQIKSCGTVRGVQVSCHQVKVNICRHERGTQAGSPAQTGNWASGHSHSNVEHDRCSQLHQIKQPITTNEFKRVMQNGQPCDEPMIQLRIAAMSFGPVERSSCLSNKCY